MTRARTLMFQNLRNTLHVGDRNHLQWGMQISLGNEFSLPPDDVDIWTSLTYFKLFWNDSNGLIADQTNLYSVQKTSKSINTEKGEIELLIGIQIYMVISKLPSFFWGNETRYAPIANIVSLNRYKQLREYLHVSDNSKMDESENKNKKLYKIQPLLYHVSKNCRDIETEIEHSIDEQIIPAKTRRSGIRQYNPRKPVKWGFKNIVRFGALGIMYDFFLWFNGEGEMYWIICRSAIDRKLAETPTF